jgi:dCTP deaminase
MGMTFGLGPCGYDIRIREKVRVYPGDFICASSIEEFTMPNNIMGVVHDKSTWARMGLAVQNTVLEPGWKGFLTLELTNHHKTGAIRIEAGMPIAQVVFYWLDAPTDTPYKGKYQNQPEGPQEAILEPDETTQ